MFSLREVRTVDHWLENLMIVQASLFQISILFSIICERLIDAGDFQKYISLVKYVFVLHLGSKLGERCEGICYCKIVP